MVETNAIEALMPFVKGHNQLFAMKSLLIISYLVSEEENHLICSHTGYSELSI